MMNEMKLKELKDLITEWLIGQVDKQYFSMVKVLETFVKLISFKL